MFRFISPDSTSIQIHARTAVVLSIAHHPVLCAAPPPNIILFMPKSSSPFFFFCLFLFCSFPSLQILPVKNTGEKMRGRKWRRAKSLRGEGPIKRGPVPSTECAQRWSKMKEVKKRRRRKKKKKRLSILSKDRFLSYSERRANREAGWGLD